MKELPNVSLICVDGLEKPNLNRNNSINQISKLFDHSSKHIKFGEMLYLTAQLTNNAYKNNVHYIKIPPLNYLEYNIFLVKELVNYIKTDYFINFQSDGFIVDGKLWKDDFLRYDYVGAPWPKQWDGLENNRVGNGGFSLRSKNLIKLCSKIIDTNKSTYPLYLSSPKQKNTRTFAEDWTVCCVYYKQLIKEGVRFAPPDIASQFSMEHDLPDLKRKQDFKTHFGFHSPWWLYDLKDQIKKMGDFQKPNKAHYPKNLNEKQKLLKSFLTNNRLINKNVFNFS